MNRIPLLSGAAMVLGIALTDGHPERYFAALLIGAWVLLEAAASFHWGSGASATLAGIVTLIIGYYFGKKEANA